MGNNNTGKTTILRLLSGLEATEIQINLSNKKVLGLSTKGFKQLPSMWDLSLISETFQVQALLQSSKVEQLSLNWHYSRDVNSRQSIAQLKENPEYSLIKSLIFYAYGTSRRMSSSNITENSQENNISPLFDDSYELANAEEWLLQLDYAAKSGVPNANAVLEKLKTVLSNGLLPDIKTIELKSELDAETNSVKNYALFDTDYGKVRLKGLGYGYQSTMAWVVDLAKKLFERYPKLENPLTGAAIVLVDEIDLHLHPDWQRKIISHLSSIFPNVQFIVTAHSPLIIQSAENVNLIILEKGENNQTHIRQEFGTFKGWTVEEILQDLMGLGDKTLSDTYLHLLNQFEEGLDDDDYDKAKAAYDAILPLLHPTSSQRKLLKLQIGAIAPAII